MFKGQGTLILKLKNRRNDPDEFYGRKSSNTNPSKLLWFSSEVNFPYPVWQVFACGISFA